MIRAALIFLLACTPKTPHPDPAVSAVHKDPSVPPHPSALVFPDQTFTAPLATDFRHELSNGVPVYLASASDLPLVTVTFTFAGGKAVESPDQTGLAELAFALLVEGGTETTTPEALEEAFALLAADVRVSSGTTSSTLSLDVLKENLAEALSLFTDMTRRPGFDGRRAELAVATRIESMKSRNDDAGAIAAREWARLLYGDMHVEAAVSTATALRDIDSDDLKTFHRRFIHPGNLVIGVHGDVTADEALPMLESALAGWVPGERVPRPVQPEHLPTPGVYHVQKSTPQGKVRLGHRGIQRDDPDFFPLLVMNDILGGGGFTSRITGRVRSDEGLAYGARSGWSLPADWPGTFQASFDSKNPTVALATTIVIEEMTRIREQPVSDTELADAKAALIAQLPRTFSSRDSLIRTFVSDEITGRDPGFWQRWASSISAVTAEDVQRVASAHLHPDQLVILVVGDWGPIAQGDPAGRATMAPLGPPTPLPLRDPLTQVVLD